MNNFSRNKVRLATISNTTFTANDQIVIQLPEGLVDLSTFTLTGRLTTGAAGTYAPFAEGLIESIFIEVGGISAQNGFTNYNDLFNIYRQYQMGDKYSLRKILQNEQTLTTAGAFSNYTCSNVPFAIYNWLGMLGSVKVLDTTILPPVKLYIRLASNAVLACHANATTKTFTLTDVKASVDLISVDDGIYYNLIKTRLQSAPIEIPFDSFQCVTGTQGSVTSSTRWSTSADCLTDVIATVKGVNFDSNVANSNILLSDYFKRGGGDTSTTQIATSQFSVNGIRYPTIPCTNADGEIFIDTAHTLGVTQDVLGQCDPSMDSLSRWSSNFFVHAHSFTFPDSDDSSRLVGLSGRGNQIMGTFELTGSGSNVLPIVWLKSKSVLRVGNSKMVEVVL
jgi:hypothetical protein